MSISLVLSAILLALLCNSGKTSGNDCQDASPNCRAIGHEVCSSVYQQYAQIYCREYCEYCNVNITGVPMVDFTENTPTENVTCFDNDKSCREMGVAICSDPYGRTQCREFCEVCTGSVTSVPPTIPDTTSTVLATTSPEGIPTPLIVAPTFPMSPETELTTTTLVPTMAPSTASKGTVAPTRATTTTPKETTTVAPTTAAPTEVATKAPITATPIEVPTTAASTKAPSTEAPTEASSTAVSTEAPTQAPTTDVHLAVCNTTAEVIFVLDASSSVGNSNFEKMRVFTQNVTGRLKKEYTSLNVTVITFSDNATVAVELDESFNISYIQTAIEHMQYTHGGTNTHLALKLMSQSFNQAVYGPKIAIVITDGASFEPDKTLAESTQAKKEGTVIFVVGVGDDVNTHEAMDISSEPHSRYFYSIGSFTALDSIVGEFHSQDCLLPTTRPPATTTTTEATTTAAPSTTPEPTTTSVTPAPTTPEPTTTEPTTPEPTTPEPTTPAPTTPEPATPEPTTPEPTTPAPTTPELTTPEPTTPASTTPEPTTPEPTTPAPTTPEPTTPAPTTPEPATPEPTTPEPTTPEPTTPAPTTPEPSTPAPTTPEPTTPAPTTPEPTTPAPTTPEPSTPAPTTTPAHSTTEPSTTTTTAATTPEPTTTTTPTTPEPTTTAPTTTEPTTTAHTTTEPTTTAHTTPEPTTQAPTTPEPTTQAPTTPEPTTPAPTTPKPTITTAVPTTTASKTTLAPTTVKPTTVPTTPASTTTTTPPTPAPTTTTTKAPTTPEPTTTTAPPTPEPSTPAPAPSTPEPTTTQEPTTPTTSKPTTTQEPSTPTTPEPTTTQEPTIRTVVTTPELKTTPEPTTIPPTTTTAPTTPEPTTTTTQATSHEATTTIEVSPPRITPSVWTGVPSISTVQTSPIVSGSTSSPTTTTTVVTTTTTPASTTTATCIAKVADIVFVVDSSGSIGLQNFENVKSFIKAVINTFEADDPRYTRVGLIGFSTTAQIQFKLGEKANLTELMNGVSSLPYSGGGTTTSDALELMRMEGFDRERPDAPDIAIVITDGLSKYPALTRIQAALAKDSGITMFTIGIGNDTEYNELLAMASDKRFVFEVGDFSKLGELDNAIAHMACGVNLPDAQHTRAPTTLQPTMNGCYDLAPDCDTHPRDFCTDYEPYARKNCAKTCKFCPANSTLVEPPCVDDPTEDCAAIGFSGCNDASLYEWTSEHCPKFCGFCTKKTDPLPTDMPITEPPPPSTCKNKMENCHEFGGYSMCTSDTYEQWAHHNCPSYCGYCYDYHNVTSQVVAGIQCPSWTLPTQCSLVYKEGQCCPYPECPDNFRLTVKRHM